MATHPAVRRWTYEEFAALPDDGNRYEIIAGELYMTPSSRPNHSWVASQIFLLITNVLKEHGLKGWVTAHPVDVLFAEDDYMVPDVVFVRSERVGIVNDRGIRGAPDLVVEVLSESTASRDRGIKRERYARYGVPEYWVVDVDRRHIEVYRLQEDPLNPRIVRDRLTWTPFPGAPALEIPLDELFRDPGSLSG